MPLMPIMAYVLTKSTHSNYSNQVLTFKLWLLPLQQSYYKLVIKSSMQPQLTTLLLLMIGFLSGPFLSHSFCKLFRGWMTGSQEASPPLGGIYWQLVFLGTCGFSFVNTTSSLFLKRGDENSSSTRESWYIETCNKGLHPGLHRCMWCGLGVVWFGRCSVLVITGIFKFLLTQKIQQRTARNGIHTTVILCIVVFQTGHLSMFNVLFRHPESEYPIHTSNMHILCSILLTLSLCTTK
jgi:hypothetical protein